MSRTQNFQVYMNNTIVSVSHPNTKPKSTTVKLQLQADKLISEMESPIQTHNGNCPPGCFICSSTTPSAPGTPTLYDILHAFLTIVSIPLYLLLTLPNSNLNTDKILNGIELIWIISCFLEEFGTGPFVVLGSPPDTLRIMVSLYFILRRERAEEEERWLEEVRGDEGEGDESE